MAKPDPALLDPARYPFHCSIAPRFGDLDVSLHINNVAIAGMLEDARVRFHRASGYSEALDGLTSMMANITIEYIGQGFYPTALDVYAGISRVGRTSHALTQFMTQDSRPIAFATSVIVTAGSDGPQPLPASFADFAAAWLLVA